MHANAPKFIKLYKIAQNGKIYPKTVFRKDWVSDVGYQPLVRSSSEQEIENTKAIQKFLFVQQQFPNNLALRKIAQKRELEILDLTPDELKQVEDAEKKSEQILESQSGNQPQAVQPIEQPNPQLMQQIQEKMTQLQ